jgi:hypothetical protein
MPHQSANVASIMSRRAALVTIGDLFEAPIGPQILREAEILRGNVGGETGGAGLAGESGVAERGKGQGG